MIKMIPEIPHSYLVLCMMICLVTLRYFGIDTFVTAGLTAIISYLIGVKQEQIRKGSK